MHVCVRAHVQPPSCYCPLCGGCFPSSLENCLHEGFWQSDGWKLNTFLGFFSLFFLTRSFFLNNSNKAPCNILGLSKPRVYPWIVCYCFSRFSRWMSKFSLILLKKEKKIPQHNERPLALAWRAFSTATKAVCFSSPPSCCCADFKNDYNKSLW